MKTKAIVRPKKHINPKLKSYRLPFETISIINYLSSFWGISQAETIIKVFKPYSDSVKNLKKIGETK